MERGTGNRPRQPRLFIVDAFRDESDMYSAFFLEHGFQVEVFGRPDAALRAARQNPPDAIITRIRQEKGQIDGIEMTARLRREAPTPTVPIVVITTSILRGDHEAARKAGCDACLLLPATPDDLLKQIEVLLRRDGRGAAGQRES